MLVATQQGAGSSSICIHGQVDGRVEAKTALVGTQRRVKLHAVAAVHAKAAAVVLPGDAELDDALGDGADLEGGAVLGVLLEKAAVLEGGGELCDEGPSVLVGRGARVCGKAAAEATHLCRPARTQARKEG